MITVLSPSKRLNYDKSAYNFENKPKFSSKAYELVETLRKKNKNSLQKMMDINDDLAQLNYDRYRNFSKNYNKLNSKPAILAFRGDVYLGLDAESMTKWDLNFAEQHIRILSGLYGLLRPMDAMQAYRLEMGTNLKNSKGKNLYEFWGDQITAEINKALSGQKEATLVNLASKEYFSSIDTGKIKGDIIDINFREFRNGQLKFLSFNAKKARGLMARYIIKERIEKKKHLKGFNYENYHFDEERSDEKQYTFIR